MEPPGYWCDICQQVVTDKRCPLCGLKARKMRMGGGVKKGEK
jgi:predicted RNA-binding protein with PUA domain